MLRGGLLLLKTGLCQSIESLRKAGLLSQKFSYLFFHVSSLVPMTTRCRALCEFLADLPGHFGVLKELCFFMLGVNDQGASSRKVNALP